MKMPLNIYPARRPTPSGVTARHIALAIIIPAVSFAAAWGLTWALMNLQQIFHQ